MDAGANLLNFPNNNSRNTGEQTKRSIFEIESTEMCCHTTTETGLATRLG
jgi:hypothetical protein